MSILELTFLGTGAGESYPGIWCQCPNCTYARQKRGKNLRANSCALLDRTILLDMGPLCFHQAVQFGIDLTQVKTLLVTHSHPDHLYPRHLHWRAVDEGHLQLNCANQMQSEGPRFTPLPELAIFGNRFVEEALMPVLSESPSMHAHFTRIQEAVSFETEGYTITPVRGNHGISGFAHGYVIEKDGKTMLYALDTGSYEPAMQTLLESFYYDLVVMEGTTGVREQYGGHMCLENNITFKRRLEERGCLKEHALFYLTHLSPHWCPPHDFYEVQLKQYGINLAYDGLSILF